MDFYVLCDLVGTILAFLGGCLMAVPAFRDNDRRHLIRGLDTVLDALGNNPGKPKVLSVREAVEKEGYRPLSRDRRLLQIGIVLLTVGLLLSIPVKARDLGLLSDSRSSVGATAPRS